MANVLDLRRRIRSVKNTRQITKAMKMVSAARLRRAQERAMQARPYAQMIANVLESLVRRTDRYNDQTGEILHPLLEEREEKNVLVVVVAGDKGFAGAFNSNIVKAAPEFHRGTAARRARTVDIEPIGRKAATHVGKRLPQPPSTRRRKSTTTTISPRTTRSSVTVLSPIEVAGDHADLLLKIDIDEGQRPSLTPSSIANPRRDRLGLPRLQRVQVRHRAARRRRKALAHPQARLARDHCGRRDDRGAERGRRAAQLQPSGVSLYEPEESAIESEAKKFGTADVDYIYDQSPERLFRHLMPRYVTTQIFHALLESVAAEHAARMTAMDAATNNAGDMIDAYTLQMNRVRQAAITKEIIEIVSGAALCSQVVIQRSEG